MPVNSVPTILRNALAGFFLTVFVSGCLSLPQPAPAVVQQKQPSLPPVWADVADSPFESSPHVERSVASHGSSKPSNEKSSVTEKVTGSKPQRSTDRVASRNPVQPLVQQPAAFAWKSETGIPGGPSIQSATIGKGGYRTLFIGSLTGNDSPAVDLTERLASHLHQNQIVLGGIQLTLIRNLNPFGEENEVSETADGVYLNRQFPDDVVSDTSINSLPGELQYLFRQIRQHQPQRIIHLRTIGREQGVVASSSGALDVAKDVAGWLDFQLLTLPGTSAPGTIERYLAETDQCDVVTFAFPQDVSAAEAWDLYSDALLNLLMDEDFATRKMARERRNSKAADRRNSK